MVRLHLSFVNINLKKWLSFQTIWTNIHKHVALNALILHESVSRMKEMKGKTTANAVIWMRLSFILFVESLNWYYAVLMHSQRLLKFIKQSLLQCSFTAHNEIYAHETVEKNSSFSQPPPEILSPHSVYNGTKSVYDFFFMEIVFSNERGVFLWRDGSMSGFYFFFLLCNSKYEILKFYPF